jgi:hypothetical protein
MKHRLKNNRYIINLILPLVLIASIGVSVWGVSNGKFEPRKQAGFMPDDGCRETANGTIRCPIKIVTAKPIATPIPPTATSKPNTPTPKPITPTPTNPNFNPSPTPIITATPYPSSGNTSQILVFFRFTGVTDGSAEGAKAVFSLYRNTQLLSSQTLEIIHTVENGIYGVIFEVETSKIPAGSGYYMTVKGEKHVQKKFCKDVGQTNLCQSGESITIPTDNTDLQFDFVDWPLDPGDLYVQNGIVDMSDFQKVINLLSKACSELTDTDKLTADLDYNGCVEGNDVVLMRKTMETQYDQN